MPRFHRFVTPFALSMVLLGWLGADRAAAQSGASTDSAKVVEELDPPPPAVDLALLRILSGDSVTAPPGEVYPANGFHRFWFGDLNRDLWTLPITVPVLDLDAVGGGLSLDELSGGKQTLGLRLEGKDGVTYQFRSIVKSASRAIPGPLQGTPVEDALTDQMAAQFPLGAMVVAELLIAADILVARPRPVIMPDDPRLGEYRAAFAGRMGWIEVRPNEGEDDTPGFAGSSKITGSDELYEELREEPRSQVNAPELLRARLIDMFVGDWDRHSGQWRWARYDEPDGRIRWDPIPRDRDWAFSRLDGVFPTVAAVYFPRYVGFGEEYPGVINLSWSGQRIDRTLLSGLDREDFRRAARDLQAIFSDEVLSGAVALLPPSYLDAIGEELTAALQARRDGLDGLAERYYELLAGWVDVWGTDEVDSVHVTSPSPGAVRVVATAPAADHLVRYDRTFLASETHEVRVYLRDGDDRVVIEGPGSVAIPLRIVGAAGDDGIVDGTDGSRVLWYDDEGDNLTALGEEALETNDALLVQDSLRTGYTIWSSRDWGSSVVPRPEFRWNSDMGPFVGFGIARYGFGFGVRPYRSRLSASLLNGFEAGQWIADVEFERALGGGGWRVAAETDLFTDKPTWLFGIGNDVAAPESTELYRSTRSEATVGAGIRFHADTTWQASMGISLRHAGAVEPGALGFDELAPYGADQFTHLRLDGGLQFDTRDDRDLPTRGLHGRVGVKVAPAAIDAVEAFGGIDGSLTAVAGAPSAPLRPTFHLRATGERVWGRAPYHELASLGGSSSLPGFVSERFLGHTLASGAALLRLEILELDVLSGLKTGVHGLAATGRVWSDQPESDTWHRAFGGGAWIHLGALGKTVGFTAVEGDDGVRGYIDFGFIF